MSQLRQPGDYLKYNRTRAPPTCVHTFTVETNQIEGKFLKKERTVQTPKADRTDEFSTRYRTDEFRSQHSQRQLHLNYEKRTDIQVNHSKTVIANGKTSCQKRKDTLRWGCQQTTMQAFK